MKNITKAILILMVAALTLTIMVSCDQFQFGEQPEECKHLSAPEYIPGRDASCTDIGLSPGFKCSDCGEITMKQEETPALGHEFADANCTDPKTCTRCGATEGEALGHIMVNVEALDPTCTAKGYTAHQACDRCDYTEGKEEIAATGHFYTIAVEALAPTTCEDGYTAHNACECGATDENFEVVYAPHNISEESYFYYPSAPTCTEDAYIAGTCSDCGESFILDVASALGHSSDATCTEGGTCSVCGEAVGALGHSLVDAEGLASTCTEEGYTAHKKCENCDYTEGKEVVGIIDHSLVEGVCSVCGYIPNVFANKVFVGSGDAAANIYSAGFGYQTLTDGIIYEEASGRFSSKQNGGKVEGIIDLGAVYELDEFKVYIYWGGLEKLGTGFEIQVCFGGEWTSVVKCDSIEAMQAYWVDNPDSVDKDWLVFDLDGVAARQVKFTIPGQTSAAWTTLYELECSAKVSDQVEPEPEKPILVDNILAGKTFTPTDAALASVLVATWWKGSGYEGLTDGIKNADNSVGRFSTVMKTTGMMDATIDLGGTYELHTLKFYTYDPAAGTGASSLGADLLIQVYADGEWKDVVVCADNATLASYLVVNEGTYNDYLEFDLEGIKAEKIRFYISASASTSGTTYEEIECSGYAK